MSVFTFINGMMMGIVGTAITYTAIVVYLKRRADKREREEDEDVWKKEKD